MSNMKSRAVVIFLTIVASIPKYVIKKVLSIFNRNDAEPRSTCVICISHIGDNLCCLPALSLLRQKYPKAQITFFTSRPLVKLLERNPYNIDIQDYNEKDVCGIFKLVCSFKLYDAIYPLWHKRELLLAQSLWNKSIIAPESFIYNLATIFKDRTYKQLDVLSVEEMFCSAWVKPEELVDNHVKFFVHHEPEKWFNENRTEQNRTEQNRTEQNRTEQYSLFTFWYARKFKALECIKLALIGKIYKVAGI